MLGQLGRRHKALRDAQCVPVGLGRRSSDPTCHTFA
jgi:hypothetical protein